ncbi:MAG: ATP synthase F1 subunit delta [Bacteroidota bacterium]|nr:ATP synthase F1 subunit delta [Bacteroidota bacterium]
MYSNKVANRYAKSLLDLAIENKVVDQVYKDMLGLKELTENKDFGLLLKSPIIISIKKTSIVKAILKDKIHSLTLTFIELLISKTRESYLPLICVAFIDQYKAFKKIRIAKLITAEVLPEDQIQNIKEHFQFWLKDGETMEIHTKVNPKIIGGFIFEMGDQQYDASAKNKMDLIRTKLYDSSYINLVVNK